MSVPKRYTSLSLIISVLFCCVSGSRRNEIIFQNEDYRLPTSVWPENYKLELMVVLDPLAEHDRFTAPGKSWIKINSSEPTSVITMHAINLTINENSITVKNVLSSELVSVIGIAYIEEYDFLNINLATPLEVNEAYEIFIEFITPIYGDRLNGMYQDFYEDPDTGETRYIATTLFAPYHARRAFPCFDEPSFRATYDITLGHHKSYHAMSNTDIVETRPIENMTDWQWDTFATTPSISSYIIAMIVSDMTYEEGPVNNFRNVSVRVYAKPQSIAEGAGTYSAKLAGDVMTFLESLFVVQYPLSKLYSVALPQFFFSAMENWGLITYKEPVLLYLKNETTEEERYIINYVLSHEESHQYFGNLIAVRFWTYVWLKEGFATYFSYYGMNHTNPEFVPWVQFSPKILYVAMDFDASNQTHPLENYPPTSAAVANIYTRIPYNKGASILRMASSFLTEAVFLGGIKEYVNKFQYSNADQYDMFEQLQQSVNNSTLIFALLPTTVKEILSTWTTQAGFPVLTVSTPNATTLQITQKKYMDGDTSNPDDTWWVPIYLSVRPNNSLPEFFPDTWIPQNTSSVSIDIATDRVIIVNPWTVGYYRVLYEKQPIARIIQQFNSDHRAVSAIARSKIINDYASFTISGFSDVETLIQLTSYMNKEVDLVVWEGLLPFLHKISKLLENHSTKVEFQWHFGQMAFEAMKALEQTSTSIEQETGMKSMLKSVLMKLSCDFQVHFCVQSAFIHFNKWKMTEMIPLSVQEAVFCTSVANDTESQNWKYIFHYLKESTLLNRSFSPLKSRLIKSLGCSNNPENLKQLIEIVIKNEKIFEYSDKVELLLEMASRPSGTAIIWEELSASLNILNIFKSQKNLQTFLDELCSFPLTDANLETLQEIRDFVQPEIINAVDNCIWRVEANKQLLERITEPLMQNLMHFDKQ